MGPPPGFRERTEELERASLSSWATLATDTKGRDRYEAEDPFRTVFQADRDRIVASSEWALLASKSAALPARSGRSQLDEVVDVVRVTRTIARALRLNEDLGEAIALGQSLGALPFADAGEEGVALATAVPVLAEEQALRVVERLSGGCGLNLSWETRDGILNQRWDGPAPATLEGDVARFARRIIQVCALLEDALAVEALPAAPRAAAELGASYDERVARMTSDVINASWDRPRLAFSPQVALLQEETRATAADGVAASPAVAQARARAVHCVASLAVFLLEGGVAAGDAQPDGSQPRPADVVDALGAMGDGALLDAYRAAFEPGR